MSLTYLLQTPPITTVTVVRLSHLGYGEIQPNFIIDNFTQLSNAWCIISQTGRRHFLRFNKNYDHPALISGWEELIEFHHLPNDLEIEFAFYGENRFSIMSFKEPTVAEAIQPFHRRSLCPVQTIHFDILLNQTHINQQQLTLPADLKNYVESRNFKWFMICGDNLDQYAVAVINKNNNPVTKINAWDLICNDLDFKIGDTIRFKFAHNDPHKRAHIYKPFPYRRMMNDDQTSRN